MFFKNIIFFYFTNNIFKLGTITSATKTMTTTTTTEAWDMCLEPQDTSVTLAQRPWVTSNKWCGPGYVKWCVLGYWYVFFFVYFITTRLCVQKPWLSRDIFTMPHSRLLLFWPIPTIPAFVRLLPIRTSTAMDLDEYSVKSRTPEMSANSRS